MPSARKSSTKCPASVKSTVRHAMMIPLFPGRRAAGRRCPGHPSRCRASLADTSCTTICMTSRGWVQTQSLKLISTPTPITTYSKSPSRCRSYTRPSLSSTRLMRCRARWAPRRCSLKGLRANPMLSPQRRHSLAVQWARALSCSTRSALTSATKPCSLRSTRAWSGLARFTLKTTRRLVLLLRDASGASKPPRGYAKRHPLSASSPSCAVSTPPASGRTPCLARRSSQVRVWIIGPWLLLVLSRMLSWCPRVLSLPHGSAPPRGLLVAASRLIFAPPLTGCPASPRRKE
mmetsp:Transcript_4159/g.6482  ORF Transcript_4159/g.6482 Transcript_4159/m.6482 type:complete len:290 (-) Transcript_4159:477-1346(-)